MKARARLLLMMIVLFCLGLLVCGCHPSYNRRESIVKTNSKGGPPPKGEESIIKNPIPKGGPHYMKGYKLALQYRNGEIRDYRLVIELYPLVPSGRDDFLQGFKAAYAEANDGARGEKYADILKQSLAGSIYEEAFEQGRKHVRGLVAHDQIRSMIRRSVGLSPGFELGWKAGYIGGFVQEILNHRPNDKETLYEQAEAMYNSLSWIGG